MIHETRCHRLGQVAAAAVGALVIAAGAAQAQTNYPNKPIRMMVGFAPGGPTDILARVVGAGMAKVVGEQLYIENRSGAGGNIATEATARAEPDGYSTLMLPMSAPINESLFKNFKIRFAEHFEPIGGIAQTGLVLLVNPTLDVKSVADLIKLAKGKPGEVLYASAGAGTATHLAAELFNAQAGVKMMPVHYKGGGDTLKDLLSGEMKVMFSTIPPVLPFVKDGRLRGIATTAAKRDMALPELPTIAESGVPNFDVPLWFGLAVPKGTPKPVIDKLAHALKQALAMPDVKDALAKQGFESMEMTPEQFAKFYAAEATKWAKVVETTGMAH